MERVEITCQRAFVYWIAEFVFLTILIVSQDAVAAFFGIGSDEALFEIVYLVCGAVLGLIFADFMAKRQWFRQKAVYYTERGTVYVEKGRKTYALQDVKALYGTTVSSFWNTKAAMLKIESPKKRLTLIASLPHEDAKFADTELAGLFNRILACNPALQKSAEDGDLYERREIPENEFLARSHAPIRYIGIYALDWLIDDNLLDCEGIVVAFDDEAVFVTGRKVGGDDYDFAYFRFAETCGGRKILSTPEEPIRFVRKEEEAGETRVLRFHIGERPILVEAEGDRLLSVGISHCGTEDEFLYFDNDVLLNDRA